MPSSDPEPPTLNQILGSLNLQGLGKIQHHKEHHLVRSWTQPPESPPQHKEKNTSKKNWPPTQSKRSSEDLGKEEEKIAMESPHTHTQRNPREREPKDKSDG
ncbi:hypothetical protein Dimus_038282 [Dionaea muscipula]